MLKSCVHILLAVLAILVASANAEQGSVRIVAGHTTTIDKVPYLVQLRRSNTVLCGGTLVTPTHVVTAAHCLAGRSDEGWVVVAGATMAHESGVERSVIKSFSHEKYDDRIFSYDIAVLKLNAPMPLGGDKIRLMSLCSAPVPDNQLMQISGWGAMSPDILHPEQVRTIRIPKIPYEYCRAVYGDGEMSETMLCVVDLKHTKRYEVDSPCVGDSGGPGIYGDELCGVVSSGRDCGQRGHPTVFTDIMSVKPFLENALRS